jgi:hypothetical protein
VTEIRGADSKAGILRKVAAEENVEENSLLALVSIPEAGGKDRKTFLLT